MRGRVSVLFRQLVDSLKQSRIKNRIIGSSKGHYVPNQIFAFLHRRGDLDTTASCVVCGHVSRIRDVGVGVGIAPGHWLAFFPLRESGRERC